MSTCYAIQYPIFQPAMRLISAITNANPAQVTTTFAHQYITGTVVRLDLPSATGMQEANGKTGAITVTGQTTFTIDIDTRYFSPFAIPVDVSPHINTCACVVPVGEVNSTLLASTQNVLPY